MRVRRSALAEQMGRLNDTPWLSVLAYAWAAFATLSLLQLVTPSHWHAAMRSLALALPLMLLVAKDLAQLPDVLARLRGLRGRRASIASWLAACLPPALVGWSRLERVVWRGFYDWLRRQPKRARPAGLPLSYDKQGAYSTVIAFGLFSLFVDLPLNAAILPLLLHDPAALRVIHTVCLLGSLYSLAWLLGDRWQVAGGHHVLTETHLDLQVGARASACIPLDAIEDAQLLREPAQTWRRKHAVRPSQAVNVTPFDKPNMVLRLRGDADCAITHHGMNRGGVRYLFLYLDNPDQLLAALKATPPTAA